MKKTLILAASALSLALAVPVLASGDDRNGGSYGPGDAYGAKKSYDYGKNYKKYDDGKYYGSGNAGWMSPDQVRAKLTGMGYDVRRIKRDDGYYEIYAFDQNGMKVEIYLHPVSGQVIKIKRKS